MALQLLSKIMVRTRTKRMVFGACGMAQSKEETAFFLLESPATVLRKLSAKEFASERVLRHSTIRRRIQSIFAVMCLNQNFQNLSLLSYSFQIAQCAAAACAAYLHCYHNNDL